MSAIREFVMHHSLVDTHEHLISESAYLTLNPDIITSLFGQNAYIQHDLISAGCDYATLDAFLDQSNPDIKQRWHLIEPWWQHCQFTGYAEGVTLAASHVYGITSLTAESLIAAQSHQATLVAPRQHHYLLATLANLTSVQVDAFTWGIPDDADPAPFYRYDLNVHTIADGSVDLDALGQATGIQINTLNQYASALAELVRRHAPTVVAIKSQHAYTRTLAWQAPDYDDVAMVLQKKLWGVPLLARDACVIGDWALGVIAQHAAYYRLPFKIHTGHHAGNGNMPIGWINPALLDGFIKAYPDTQFVLMHIGYPYHAELLSLAKHFRNVYVDLCWAWSINPLKSSDFVRQWIHSVPINKLFGFGGDAFLPAQSVGFAWQTRTWLARTLQAEIDADTLTLAHARGIAQRLMTDNQHDLFARV
ncbi:MAG: amidohydrolase family protein [Roseiflexaceae bacterium]